MLRCIHGTLAGLSLMMMGCGYTAGGIDIWDAVDRGDSTAIKMFADSGGDLDVRSLNGSTPLWAALTEKNRDSYEALLKYGADPNVIMSGKRVVTHWAALEEDPWWLRLALEHGADPNLVNVGTGRPSEGTPLKAAISKSNLDSVKLLVEHGADVDAPDRFGCYPLAMAADQNDFKIVLYLLEAGADYTVAECQGLSFLEAIRQKVGYRDDFRLQEVRESLDAVQAWLEERGVQVK